MCFAIWSLFTLGLIWGRIYRPKSDGNEAKMDIFSCWCRYCCLLLYLFVTCVGKCPQLNKSRKNCLNTRLALPVFSVWTFLQCWCRFWSVWIQYYIISIREKGPKRAFELSTCPAVFCFLQRPSLKNMVAYNHGFAEYGFTSNRFAFLNSIALYVTKLRHASG